MIAAMGYEHILVEIEPPIATVTLNRPKVLNALSPAVIAEVSAALAELDADDSVRAVVLTGGAKVFAAGADIQDMADQGPVDQLLRDQTGRWAPLAGFKKPLIAAVNGYALGGGCEVALTCDLVGAGRTARFGARRRRSSRLSRDRFRKVSRWNARASISCLRPRTRRKACTRSWRSEKACSKDGDWWQLKLSST